MPISLEKLQETAPGLVDLRKEADRAIKLVNLEKDHTARCVLVLDHSGSMSGLYQSGEVQRIAERCLALSTAFDDDGAIEVIFFGSDAYYRGSLSIEDYQGGIDRLRGAAGGPVQQLKRSFGFGKRKQQAAQPAAYDPVPWGSTDYVAAMNTVAGLISDPLPIEDPIYCAFFTDGAPNSDVMAAQTLANQANVLPIFYSFVGIGGRGETFETLQTFDAPDRPGADRHLAKILKGRAYDNANFFDARTSSEDSVLYSNMLNQYGAYVGAIRNGGLIK